MTKENLSSLEGTTPETTVFEASLEKAWLPERSVTITDTEVPDNYVRVPLTAVLNALRAQRTATVNKRKIAQKKKWVREIGTYTEEIHDVDARIALLEAGPKNQAFQIPLREAHSWGFGLMANGRWPKL
jgi:hypothetical protein